MFSGHFAAGFALKGTEKTIPLWVLLFAVQFVDIIAMVLVLAGYERMDIVEGFTASNDLDMFMPYSHSLISVPFWCAVFVGLYSLYEKPTRKVAWVLSAAVASHWVLDLIAHVPDLPITFSPDIKLGLGLWNYPFGIIAVETAMMVIGVIFCLRAILFGGLFNKIMFGLVAGLLILLAIVSPYMETPPSTQAAATSGLVAYFLIPVLAFFSEQRMRRQAAQAG